MLVGGMTRMPAVQETSRSSPARSRTAASTRTRSWPSAPPSRPACWRRGQGRPAARRHPAHPRHRDQGRRDDQAHRAQHDDPDAQVRGVLDRRGQPAQRGDPRAPGRARDGDLQQVARQVPADRHPAGAARHPADRGRLRHRRQRHPQRVREGPRHRQGAEDRDQGRLRALRRRDQADGVRRRVARRGRQAAARAGGGPQRGRERRLPGREAGQGPRRAARRGLQDRDRGRHQGRPRVADPRTRTRSAPGPSACRPRSTRSPRRCTSAPRSSRPRAATAPPPTAPSAEAEEEVVDAEVVDEER